MTSRISSVRARWAAGAGLGAILVLSVLSARSPVAGAIRRGEPISGAVMGTDLADHAPHSDTLLVWFYRPAESRLDVLSIPRDTKITLPGYRFQRINEVFAYHFGRNRDADAAAEQVCEAVEHVFAKAGVPLRPRFYLQVDFDGFRRVIDRLGGVTVSVDEPMDYDDRAGNFHVHLAPGVRHLGGEEALGFVRYRGRSGDRGRILRQMEFVQALFKRCVSPEIVWRGPPALAEGCRLIRSNLSVWDMVFLAVEGRRLTSRQINTVLLPGRPRGATWEMDPERTAFVLNRLGEAPGAEVDVNAGFPAAGIPLPNAAGDKVPGTPAETPVSAGAVAAGASGPTTVKVWNASGRVGLAIAVVRRLRKEGFDVVEWGNYDSRQKKSRVIDRSGQFERARTVAGALGVSSLFSDVDPRLRTDADVVLGEDFGSTEMREGATSWK